MLRNSTNSFTKLQIIPIDDVTLLQKIPPTPRNINEDFGPLTSEIGAISLWVVLCEKFATERD